MHNYGSTANLVIRLQFLYFFEEKIHMTNISTPGILARSLNRGAGSPTRRRGWVILNIKPHLLPVDDFVSQLIRDAQQFLTLAKLHASTPNYIYFGVTRLEFQMKEILTEIEMRFDPKKGFTKMYKNRDMQKWN